MIRPPLFARSRSQNKVLYHPLNTLSNLKNIYTRKKIQIKIKLWITLKNIFLFFIKYFYLNLFFLFFQFTNRKNKNFCIIYFCSEVCLRRSRVLQEWKIYYAKVFMNIKRKQKTSEINFRSFLFTLSECCTLLASGASSKQTFYVSATLASGMYHVESSHQKYKEIDTIVKPLSHDNLTTNSSKTTKHALRRVSWRTFVEFFEDFFWNSSLTQVS